MLLACNDLTVSYHRHPAVHHLTCQFKLGTTTAIIGPNGAGKTTLIKALLGEIEPDSGRITMHGILRKDIAYLPQIHNIDNMLPLTVADVVLLGSWYTMGLFHEVSAAAESQLGYCLAQVGLTGFNRRYIHELSKGQLQRVLLAKIIMQQASIIILDEPFNAMDMTTVAHLLELIRSWQKQGKTVNAVLHDLHQVAKYFEYTMVLASRLVVYDKTTTVLTDPRLKDAYASRFVWHASDLCDALDA